jgi:hypothetical protein
MASLGGSGYGAVTGDQSGLNRRRYITPVDRQEFWVATDGAL